jgi:hypothetical protein
MADVTEKEAREMLDKLKMQAATGKGVLTPGDFDGLEVTGVKGKKYRWINNKTHNVDRKSTQGWELCKDPNVKGGVLVNGVHKNGDLVLAEMSEELHKEIQRKHQEKIRSRERYNDEEFQEEARRLKVKTF